VESYVGGDRENMLAREDFDVRDWWPDGLHVLSAFAIVDVRGGRDGRLVIARLDVNACAEQMAVRSGERPSPAERE
jgi:hypothetical protein